MIWLYLWFTLRATEWRMSIRRTMNESDQEANTKAVDSLLNYETVKYFGAEEREARRYDKSLVVYERAAIKTYTSLAVLNSGPGRDLHPAMTAVHGDVGLDVLAGSNTVGQFVMVNVLMLQLFIPLNFMGTMYREIKQSLTDIERMMDVLDQNPEVADRPGRRASSRSRAAPSASRTSRSTTSPSARSSTASPSRCPPARWWRSSVRRARANRPSAAS